MKNRFWRILIASLLVLSMALPLLACAGGDTTAETTAPVTHAVTETPTEAPTEAETDAPLPTEVGLPEGYATADIIYECDDDSILHTFLGKTIEDFDAVCAYYRSQGFQVYSDTTKAENRFTTFVGDGPMAHVYWFKNSGELNVVVSPTAAATLPPMTPAVTAGNTPVTVTQMKDANHVNGMGYIIQLSDGSFIVYDGSYSDQARKFVKAMQDLCPEGEKPLIRAWVLTHSHNDHYPTFRQVADRLSSNVQVEYVLLAPIDPETATAQATDTYLNEEVHADIAKFKGAKTVYVHTGMEFTFCDLKLEILMTADDLYKVGNHGNNFNNSSIVSRVYDEDYSALFLADIGLQGAELMMDIYGDHLQSDICQVSHHGVEDVPLSFYETVKASILYYPCNLWLYDQTDRHWEERTALEQRDYTKEILIAGLGQYTRAWGTTFEADAPLVIWDHPTKGPDA